MRERGDALHLDVVHLLERVVEDSGGIDDLPAHIAIVQVADEERFGREGIGLDVDVRARNLVEERRLADVRVSTDEKGAGGRIDGGETGNVFPDFFQEFEGFVLSLHDRGHTTEGGALELLASVKRIAEFEQPDVVLRDLVDEMPRSAELTEREFVVVLVVKHIEEGGEEWVEVLRERVRVILFDIPV